MSDNAIDTGFPWPVAPPGQPVPPIADTDDGKPHIWAQKGFSFRDLLDIVNPLQHLPVISSIYRWITGDTIGNLPRVVGDAVYGGPIGFATGLLSVLVKEETGKDVGEQVIAAFTGEGDHSAPATDTATANTDAANSSTPQKDATVAAAPANHDPIEVAALPADLPTVVLSAAPPSESPKPPPAPPPAVPDHPFMSIAPYRHGAAAVAPAPLAPASAGAATPAQTFISQVDRRQRQLQPGAQSRDRGSVINSQPVPLMVPPGTLPVVSPGHAYASAAPDPAEPVDFSKKMLDALDKYMAQQRQARAAGERGARVDMNQ